MSVAARYNVRVSGTGPHRLLFAHGFGCDQTMWRRVVQGLPDRFTAVLFDHVGAGHSDWSAYDPARHASLAGYAEDILDICESLPAGPLSIVGHSVGASMAVLAANRRPDLVESLVLVCPSPRFSNTADYVGGFEPADIDQLLDLLDKNRLDWSALMAPAVIGDANPAEQDEWRDNVCRIDPTVAKQFARVTFEADNRADFAATQTPTLIIDCKQDTLAPPPVGEYLARVMRQSRRLTLNAHGHCPHLTRPQEVIAAIEGFIVGEDRRVSLDH